MIITSDQEKELLQTDDEKPVAKIDLKTINLVNKTNARKTRKSKSMSPKPIPTPKPKKSTQAQNSTDDPKHNQLLSILTNIQEQNNGTNMQIVSLKNEMKNKFAAIDAELGVNKQSFKNIENKLKVMEKKVDTATYDKELTKQQQIKNNISIFGFPKADDENVVNIAICVLKAFGCNFDQNDFNGVYRTVGKSAQFSTIVVKFKEFAKKMSALEVKAKKPVTLGDITNCDDIQRNKPIFINNHVTPYFARLLAVGRQGVKSKSIHSCWIGSTGCLVKKTEDGKSINVQSMAEMARLTDDKNLTTSHKRSKPDSTSPNQSTSKKANKTQRLQ